MNELLCGAVKLLGTGIITILMIPAGILFFLIRLIWNALDNILEKLGAN